MHKFVSYLLFCAALSGSAAGQSLTLVENGQPRAYVLVRADAGEWEKRAALDLSATVAKMTGAALPVVHQKQAGLPIVVGELARDRLGKSLQVVMKKDPVLRADAIALECGPDGIFLAGSNDDSHYFAAAELMRRWGCRWYLPTDFGECIPRQTSLVQAPLRYAYAPPFEVRGYWISWNGDSSGYLEFAHRNFMNCASVPAGHAIGQYLEKVKPFEVSSVAAAKAIADQVAADFSAGKSFSLSMEDASVASTSEKDRELAGHLRDKYFTTEVLSDAYMTFYNRVAGQLLKRFPNSPARIGFLAYINLTLPPQRNIVAEKPLVAYLAAIDTDPNHPFSDPRWISRGDYLGALRGWVRVMQGRVILYDYDQSMLVWRDLPNPSHHVLQAEIKEYARLGILGFGTESRNALATTFLNLYFRGQLYWNPDLNVAGELKEFYPKFFGPAAAPMESYWSAIYQAWAQTEVIEHEFFVIPALYPRSLVQRLGEALKQTEGVQEQPYRARLDFVRRSWGILDGYTRLLSAVSVGDYASAARAGEEALAIREQLTASGGIFTTYKNMPETGPAFWPGEVELMRDLAKRATRRVRQSPVNWDYRADPKDLGIWRDWAGDVGPWTPVRSDLYLQAQKPETEPGFAWYRWKVTLKAEELAGLHLYFPGLFNESWLYVNGHLVSHRPQKELWWLNDYAFAWDAPLEGLKPGENTLVVRNKVGLHVAGLFRPPFLYRP